MVGRGALAVAFRAGVVAGATGLTGTLPAPAAKARVKVSCQDHQLSLPFVQLLL